MNEDVRAHLRNAYERLKDAEGMLSLARYAGTVNRTYWTMFEAACAMLASRGVKVESHDGAIIKFGELFARTDELPREFGRMLNDAFELRKDADYAIDSRAEIPCEVAEQELRKAKEFLAMAEQFLKGAGGDCE